MSLRAVYPLLAQQQTRRAAAGVAGELKTVGRSFSARSPGWRASCDRNGRRGIISWSADLYAVEVSCWGQM